MEKYFALCQDFSEPVIHGYGLREYIEKFDSLLSIRLSDKNADRFARVINGRRTMFSENPRFLTRSVTAVFLWSDNLETRIMRRFAVFFMPGKIQIVESYFRIWEIRTEDEAGWLSGILSEYHPLHKKYTIDIKPDVQFSRNPLWKRISVFAGSWVVIFLLDGIVRLAGVPLADGYSTLIYTLICMLIVGSGIFF